MLQLHKLFWRMQMKLTRQRLRRIIKEEKARILAERHPAVEEGIWRGTYQGITDWLDAEFNMETVGEEPWQNPAYTESVADALETIASELRTGRGILK